MSADPSMLSLFAGEARGAVAKIRAALPSLDGARAASAAKSLRSAAKMLGFEKYAALAAKLEAAFSEDVSAASSNPDVARAVGILSDCADVPPERIPGAVSEKEPEISAALETDFSRGKSAPAPAPSLAIPAPRAKSGPRDSEMFGVFIEDAQTQSAALSEGLLRLERSPGDMPAADSLMRASHSLKGAARVVGLEWLVNLAHKMEDCFSAAREGRVKADSAFFDLLFDCADFIASAVAARFDGADESAAARLAADISALLSGSYKPVQAREAPAPHSGPAPKTSGSSVKVSAKSLSSLMELAAESLVENGRIEPYREAMIAVKNEQEQIARHLENAIYALEGSPGAEAAQAHLELARRAVHKTVADMRAQIESFGEYSRRNVLIAGRLYSEVLSSRMRPFSDGAASLPRMVRDIAKSFGKKIDFEIEGAKTPVDRDVLEKLESALMHIVRNACDHGIEAPEEREAAGKPPCGKITMRAWHSAGFLKISVSDDGRGISDAAVREKILEKRLAAPEMLENISEDELYSFLLLPGFTTKPDISEISGRGVGLDVVQTMLHEVGGTISISSRAGAGSTFELKLPITRSVLKSLVVEIAGQPYAFALARVYRTVKLDASQIRSVEGRQYFDLDGKSVGLVSGARALGFEESGNPSNSVYAVVVADRDNLYGIEIDSLPAESELVVRPLHERLGKIPCVSSASLSEDGLPILILDVDDLVSSIDKFLSSGDLLMRRPAEAEAKDLGRILVVDDSITVRETQRQILEGAGYRVDTAVDGMDGWNSVRLNRYDLIVSDIDMPRLNGFEFIEKVRSKESAKSTPIIIVSYKDRQEDRAKGLEAGADAYLTKSSFQDDTFIETVRSLISE